MRGDSPSQGSNAEGASDAGSSASDRQQIVDLEFLRGLISAIDASGIDSLEISRGGTRIRLAKTPAGTPGHPQTVHMAGALPPVQPHLAPVHAVPPSAAETAATTAAAAAASNLVEIKSPMVGTFYRAPSPEAPSYAEVGSRVAKGQTLCILEAMKLMNELESDVQGIVREICVENAEPVEYGQVLFRIEPTS